LGELPAALSLPSADTIPVPAQQADTNRLVQKLTRILKDTFVSPWSTYLTTAQRNEISTQLRSLEVESLEAPATDAASLLLDSEPSADPPQLRAIIDAQVSSKTASLQKDLANLRSKLDSLSKNAKRGQSTGASNKKKSSLKKPAGKASHKNGNQADAGSNDSSGAAKKQKKKSAPPAAKSPKQSQQKSKKKKRRSKTTPPTAST
jgi:hypothetical protein